MSEIQGINDEKLFNQVITKQEDVVDVSKKASDFCNGHGFERKTGMYIALAIEEMANNIISYGFSDGKAHSIDIRIIANDEDAMLRIRDNCRNFDPVKYLELHQSDDPVAHIGIKMVMKLVKDAKYETSLGLNNLLITL